MLAYVFCCKQGRTISNDMKQYAKSLLQYYVSKTEPIYGCTITTYNVQNLVHLTDVLNHNVGLHEISAFPFENYMQVIKKFVSNAKNQIAQIVRLHELDKSG